MSEPAEAENGIAAWISNRPPVVVPVNVLLGTIAVGTVSRFVLQQPTFGGEKLDELIQVCATTNVDPAGPCIPCVP